MPSLLDLLDLSTTGQRSTSYRFDLLDRYETVIGELHPDADAGTPTITFDTSRFICRDMSNFNLTPNERGEINTLTDRVRVWMVLPDGYEFSMGVFLFADEGIPRTGWGDAMSATLVDKGMILDQPVTRSVNAPANRDVRAVLLSLIAATGVSSAIDSPSIAWSALGQPVSWPAGTLRSQILSDLCAQTGYERPWFDRAGVCQVKQLIDADTEHDTILYDRNVYSATTVFTNDLLHTPNQTVVISSDAQDQAYVGIYNVPAGLPWSAAQRGFVIAEVHNLEGINSLTQAEAAARSIAIGGRNREIFVEHATLAGPPDPRHDGHDVIEFDGFRWLEESWSLQLSAGGPMTHTMRRSISG
jgi:hypothetical protein